jgi:hypothetical protein
MDVRSALLTCLAWYIRYESTRFGVLGNPLPADDSDYQKGNITTTIFKGDQDIANADLSLQAAIAEFNSTNCSLRRSRGSSDV